MPPRHGGYGAAQCAGIQRSVELDGDRDVVGRVEGIELMQEPQPLLGMGQRRPRGRLEGKQDLLLDRRSTYRRWRDNKTAKPDKLGACWQEPNRARRAYAAGRADPARP